MTVIIICYLKYTLRNDKQFPAIFFSDRSWSIDLIFVGANIFFPEDISTLKLMLKIKTF